MRGEVSPIITYSDIQGGHAGEGNIDKDPLFIDAANSDLHLQYSSLCIDTGTEEGAAADDLDGYLRPVGAGYDMGAYEFHYENFIWQGLTKEWSDPDNWNYPSIPKSFNSVYISASSGTINPEIQANDAVAGKLSIESGYLTINQGKLTIGGAG